MMHLIKHFEHLRIHFEATKSATDNFADGNCVGRGGFGKVYRGELVHSKGQSIVALKRLDPRFGQGNPEFWREISMLSLYKHENIVSLLGFCDECDEKILVYEYASRRSLDMYLNSKDLSWIERLKICIGAARGLAYLHNPSGTQQRVLHRDIKSSNILLDENWNAKISDLGLSKFGPANQKYTFLVSNTVGTIGYVDPVYVETGFLTKESDVYSFGVVLFEVLCGRLCISSVDGIPQSLIGVVRQYYPQNKISEIICKSIKDEIDPKSLQMFTKIAYQCLERDLEERPLMTSVVKILEKVLEYEVASLLSKGIGGGEGASVGGGGVSSEQKLKINDALTYLKEVKYVFQDKRDKYDQFIDVMKDFKAQRIAITGVIARVKDLFEGHNNLIFGFNTFLPTGFEITEKDMSVGCPDMDDKSMMKHHKKQRKMDNRDKRRNSDDPDLDSNINRDRDLKHKPARKVKHLGVRLGSAQYDDKGALKSKYSQEFTFCENVKNRLRDPDDFRAFLKCLQIYSVDIVTRQELESLVADLLGKHTDLMEGFSPFLERCENIGELLQALKTLV